MEGCKKVVGDQCEVDQEEMSSKILKNLLVIFVLGMVILLQPALALFQFDFPVDVIGHKYIGETYLKKDNSLMGTTITHLESEKHNGKQFLVITAWANGIMQGKPFNSKLVRRFLLNKGQINSYSLTGSMTSSGQPWTDFAIFYDWENMTAEVRYQDHLKKENIKKIISLSPDVVTIQDLDLYLSSLPSRNVSEEKLQTLLPNGQTFNFRIKLSASPEAIIVNGKEFICRRIEMKPDYWLISLFFPGIKCWVNNIGYHELVRFSGMIGGPGSPDVIQSIWRIE